MGEIPSRPRVNVKLWFAVAILVSTTAGLCAGQPPASQTTNSPPQNTATTVRKTLALEEMPAEKKADILMARGEFAAAISAYQQSDLKSAIVWNNIGMAYHHLFALEEARRRTNRHSRLILALLLLPIISPLSTTANTSIESPNTGTEKP